MPYIFLGCEQTLQASLRFFIIAIHIHQNLRGTAIVRDQHRGHTHQSDPRISQLSLHKRFDLLAQGLAQPPAMIFQPPLLHLHLEVKRMRISENEAQVLALKCYCDARKSDPCKYRGNNAIGL